MNSRRSSRWPFRSRAQTGPMGPEELQRKLRSECERAGVDAETVARVGSVVEQLSDSPSSSRLPLHFSAAVFRDGIVVMLRDTGDREERLDERRQSVLRDHALTWSTVGGAEGRTLCFEVPRLARPNVCSDHA
jgi:hypothetical protein